jgi:hypothetical protein
MISAVERATAMTSLKAIRDSLARRGLPSLNAALVISDFRPLQFAFVAPMDRRALAANVIALARSAKLYGLPIVGLSVNIINVIQLIKFFLP